jgi:hypothetical protein
MRIALGGFGCVVLGSPYFEHGLSLFEDSVRGTRYEVHLHSLVASLAQDNIATGVDHGFPLWKYASELAGHTKDNVYPAICIRNCNQLPICSRSSLTDIA